MTEYSITEIVNAGIRILSLLSLENNPFVLCEYETISDEKGNIIGDRFIKMAKSCKTLWGYEPSEMIGRSFRDFVIEKDIKSGENELENNVKGEAPKSGYINTYRHKDGTEVKTMWIISKPIDSVFTCVAKRIK